MENKPLLILMALLCTGWLHGNGQIIDTSTYNSGIWQYTGIAIPKFQQPEMMGRLANFRWADLEPQPNKWDWTELDSELTAKAADSLPIIFMVYTKQDA